MVLAMDKNLDWKLRPFNIVYATNAAVRAPQSPRFQKVRKTPGQSLEMYGNRRGGPGFVEIAASQNFFKGKERLIQMQKRLLFLLTDNKI